MATTLTVGTNRTYATIQAAVDAAGAIVGPVTILVGDGNYAESVIINRGDLTLLSENGRGLTTITGVEGAALGAIEIDPNVNNVRIGEAGQGFTIIGLNGNGPIEKAAIYLQGAHSGIMIEGNDVVANGDLGLLSETAGGLFNSVVEGNIFSGKTFVGAQPGGEGFATQFDVGNNVPRQLAVINSGDDVTFKSNQITGTAGGISSDTGKPQGNTLVTIDSANSEISGNTFTGFTDRFGYALRARGVGTDVTGNVLDDSGSGQSRGILIQNQGVPGSYSGNIFTGGDDVDVVFSMTPGNDKVTLGGGNDTAIGDTGNDSVEGGAGEDTFLLEGERADFTITRTTTGFSITDNDLTDGNQGTDMVSGIEKIEFTNGSAANTTFDVSGRVQLFDANGNLVATFATLQAAEDAASVNYTIVAAAGQYAENLVIDVAGLTIKGANAGIDPNTGTRGAESIIVPGSNNATDGNVITVRADGVTIDGFTIDADNPALSGGVAMPNGADSNAARGISTGTDGGGFGNISKLTVANNVIENAQKFGIVLNSSNGVATGGNLITDNLIQDIAGTNTTGGLRFGIYMLSNTYADVTDNVLKNVGFGIGTTNFYNANPDGTSALISGNQITAQVGLFINLHYTGASRFDLVDNTLTASTVLSAPNATTLGARIWSIDDGAKLLVEDNDISGFANGYRLWNNAGSPFTISGGTLKNNTYGVNARDNESFGDTGSPNTYILRGVNFESSTVAHIRVVDVSPSTDSNAVTVRLDGTTPPTFGTAPLDIDVAGTNSRFDANGFDGELVIAGDDLANTLTGGDGGDAISAGGEADRLTGAGGNDQLNGGGGTDTAAYAGSASGYEVLGSKAANGFVTSFSGVKDTNASNGDEGTDTLDSIELLSFNDTTLNAAHKVQLFDANGNLVGTFNTIQAAENAASNDFTIRLAAGEYDEDVVVDVGVTILGAQAGTSATGRDPASGVGASNILGTVTVDAAQGVTIDGVRVVNDAIGGNSVAFLSGGGAEGHVLRNSVIYSTVQGGNSGDFAIFTATLPSGSITIDDNFVSGAIANRFSTASFQSGLYFNGGGLALTVTDNLFEYTRSGLNLDMNGASTANVTGNLFRNVGSAISVGVDADGLTIKDNDLQNAGSDFNFRNLTSAVTFDAAVAVDALTPVGTSDDLIAVLGGSGSDNLTGSEFADALDGNNFSAANADADTLIGRAGNDVISGKGGDDHLAGDEGNDQIDGGIGTDVAAYAGQRSGFSLTRGTDAQGAFITVTDINLSNGNEGTDTLRNIETLQFAGAQFAAVQAAPVAVDDANLVTEDGVETAGGNVLSNDTDVNGDSLSVTGFRAQGSAADSVAGSTIQGKYGTLTLNANGTYTYVANSDRLDELPADAQDVFTYQVSDGQGGSDEGQLVITIDERGDNVTTRKGSGAQTIDGDQGPTGAETDDTIFAGSGNDTANGGGGADNLYGESGDDRLNGGSGSDELFGGDGKDTVDGGAGTDTLVGGTGNDRMTGGSEADTFIFGNANGYDTIADFKVGEDKIVVEGITIRSVTERDVNGDQITDTIVTFGSGGGNVTLLGVSGLRGSSEPLTNPQSAETSQVSFAPNYDLSL